MKVHSKLLTLSFAVCCAALAVGDLAHAAPPGVGRGPGAGRGDVTDPARPGLSPRKLDFASPTLRTRMNARIKKNGQDISAADALAKFDPDETLDLGDGKKITVKELVTAIDESEKEASAQGSSLQTLPGNRWHKLSTETKQKAQQVELVEELSVLKQRLADVTNKYRCTGPGCMPVVKERPIHWGKEKGDKDTVAVYTDFVATEKTPDVSLASCGVTWDNGLYIMGHPISLLKFDADTNVKKADGKFSAGARASLKVLGAAQPVWKKEASFTATKLDRTLTTPDVTVDIPIIAIVRVSGGIQGSLTLGLNPNASATADANGLRCAVGAAPELAVNVTPHVSIIVGIKKLATLAEGGVKADLTVASAALPTSIGLLLKPEGPAMDLDFKSDLRLTFMKGRVYAFYKIADSCHLGVCLLEDILGIKTKGEIDLWKDPNGFAYNANLVNIHGAQGFTKPGQGMPTLTAN